MLTIERLREVLEYDPATGVFRWLVDTNVTSHGDVAGAVDKKGYRHIGIDGEVYMAHRLAWLHETGRCHTELIDHRDLDKDNNAFDNLRECDNAQNQQNRRDGRGVSKRIGVSFKEGKWNARITVDRKTKWLGRFACETAAYVAYCRAKATAHPFAAGAAHGQ
jgi:hypothetical protein